MKTNRKADHSEAPSWQWTSNCFPRCHRPVNSTKHVVVFRKGRR